MTLPPHQSAADIESFIARWSGGDGEQERANYALLSLTHNAELRPWL
jgi:hypothetical protein